MKVIIVKEVMTCDVSPVAMFELENSVGGPDRRYTGVENLPLGVSLPEYSCHTGQGERKTVVENVANSQNCCVYVPIHSLGFVVTQQLFAILLLPAPPP